jgi:hypothetical protein
MRLAFRQPLQAACVSAVCCVAGGSLSGAAQARAEEEHGLLEVAAPGFWRSTVGPYTVHLHQKAEYRYVWAVGVERQRDDLWLYGLSYFSNSFGQDSGYLYLGRQYPALFDEPKLFFQWTAGVLYGYKGAFANRVPLNTDGFSPGVVISLGWQFDEDYAVQLNKVGTSGLMLQFSYNWR